jgi:hypothetical protein
MIRFRWYILSFLLSNEHFIPGTRQSGAIDICERRLSMASSKIAAGGNFIQLLYPAKELKCTTAIGR